MPRAKQISKRKGRSKAVPVLGAAGLSLTLASGSALAKSAPSFDAVTRNTAESREIVLQEEEIVGPRRRSMSSTKKEPGLLRPAAAAPPLAALVASLRVWEGKAVSVRASRRPMPLRLSPGR